MKKYMNINYYLPTKKELRLECGTALLYFEMESASSVLYILTSILYFCEDDKDFCEVNKFFKYLSTTSDFGKDFYDKYACIIGPKGKTIVGDIFKTLDHDSVINEFNNEAVKNSNLKK